MPLSADQLRDLLAERSDPANLHPAPQEGLSMRIRRARIRRAAAAGLLAAVAAAGVVTGLHLTQDRAAGAAAVSGKEFPASFTASDGAVYRRLAVTSMQAPAQPSAALDVKVGAYPVDVMASCDVRGEMADIKVNGVDAALADCAGPPQLIGLSVRPGRQADITFISEQFPGFPVLKTSWQFAVYEWIPPAVARPAPAVPRLPLTYIGDNTVTGHGTTRLRLIASRSGDWPGDRAVTITIPDRGENIDISVDCSGAIAGRLQVTMLIRGHGTPFSCTSWTPGQPPRADVVGESAAGVPDTMTFRLQAPGSWWDAAYAKRSASWTIGIYQEGS